MVVQNCEQGRGWAVDKEGVRGGRRRGMRRLQKPKNRPEPPPAPGSPHLRPLAPPSAGNRRVPRSVRLRDGQVVAAGRMGSGSDRRLGRVRLPPSFGGHACKQRSPVRQAGRRRQHWPHAPQQASVHQCLAQVHVHGQAGEHAAQRSQGLGLGGERAEARERVHSRGRGPDGGRRGKLPQQAGQGRAAGKGGAQGQAQRLQGGSRHLGRGVGVQAGRARPRKQLDAHAGAHTPGATTPLAGGGVGDPRLLQAPNPQLGVVPGRRKGMDRVGKCVAGRKVRRLGGRAPGGWAIASI